MSRVKLKAATSMNTLNGSSVELTDKVILLPKENRDGDKEFEMLMLDG